MARVAQPDWHLQEWVRDRGKKQADLVKELGWHKNTAFRLWHGRQPYRRDEVNAVAAWLNIQPYELLMSPSDAHQVRRLKELIAEQAKAFADSQKPAPAPPRTGTAG